MSNGTRSALAVTLAAMLCALPLRSLAEVRMLQLYSTPDGEYQAILLEDDEDDGVDRFAELVFAMTSAHGTRTLALTRGPLTPDLFRDREVVVDGRRRFLLATRQMSFWLRAQAELPDAFLAIDGGTLSIVSASATKVWTFPLGKGLAWEPVPGHRIPWDHELARHPLASPEATLAADADFFAQPMPAPVVREYYHARLDRYFLATTQREKSSLDAGQPSGWERTGNYFRSLHADAAYGLVTVPVCRYYLPPPLGDTHFFSAFAEECEAVARQWPAAILETSEAFRVALPEPASGLCVPMVASEDPQHSIATVPLYRVWNGRAGANHRYTTSVADQAERALDGWIPEGYGPHGSAMCVDAFDVGTIPVPKQKPKPFPPDQGR